VLERAGFRSPRAGFVANRLIADDLPSEHINPQGFAVAAQTIKTWPAYTPSPLHHLSGQAGRLGLGEVFYKDESARFGLGSFKALGGAYAVYALLREKLQLGDGSLLWTDQATRKAAKAITVCCATDGNHGRSVAWGAELFGANCVIFVHETVSQARCEAIAAFGAKVSRVKGNYDDSVREAQRQAEANCWHVVSDTSYQGYIDIPCKVMHGYGLMAQEICDQLAEAPSHVVVQAGVGALAASLCAYFWYRWGTKRPRFVLVEPMLADCYFQSISAGHPVAVTGSLQTIMAGLACGEASPIAWQILSRAADDACVVCEDDVREAMRSLHRGESSDPSVISGETGAAGLALLQASQAMPHLAQALGLDAHSRVLIIGSEGNTDPEIYRAIIHQPPQPRTDYLLEQLHALAQIGLQDDGACSRLALTDQDWMGRDWLVDVMKSLDLNVQIDQIGNLFGIFVGAEPELDPIMTGSHIDTVRTGGRYDGCLGVLAGLEIIRCMQAAGIKPDGPSSCAPSPMTRVHAMDLTCWVLLSLLKPWPSNKPFALWASTAHYSAKNSPGSAMQAHASPVTSKRKHSLNCIWNTGRFSSRRAVKLAWFKGFKGLKGLKAFPGKAWKSLVSLTMLVRPQYLWHSILI